MEVVLPEKKVTEEEVKEAFEKLYGADKNNRTRKQWKALVKTYGYNTVSEKENITKVEVKAKCKN